MGCAILDADIYNIEEEVFSHNIALCQQREIKRN